MKNNFLLFSVCCFFDCMFHGVVRNSEHMLSFHIVNDLVIIFMCLSCIYSHIFSLLKPSYQSTWTPLRWKPSYRLDHLFSFSVQSFVSVIVLSEHFLKYLVWSYIQLSLKASNLISVTTVASYETILAGIYQKQNMQTVF